MADYLNWWPIQLGLAVALGVLGNLLTGPVRNRLALSWTWYRKRRAARIIRRYHKLCDSLERGGLIYVALSMGFIYVVSFIGYTEIMLVIVIADATYSPKPLFRLESMSLEFFPMLLIVVMSYAQVWMAAYTHDALSFGMNPSRYREKTCKKLLAADPTFDPALLRKPRLSNDSGIGSGGTGGHTTAEVEPQSK